MKVLQLLPRLNVGGVELETIEICSELTKKEVKCIIASSIGKLVFKLPKEIDFIAIKLHKKNPFAWIINAFTLAKFIKKNKIDIIHARSRVPAWTAFFLSFLIKIPLITTVHGAYKANNVLKKFYNNSMLKSDVVIAPSKFIKNYILTNYKTTTPIILVPRGIDLTRFNSSLVELSEINKWRQRFVQQEEKLIVLPGRFSAIKGHKLLIEALTKININFRCVMVGQFSGSENYIENLKLLVRNLGLQDAILFHDAIDDYRALLMASDAVVAPSQRPEAFGRVAAEACALGCYVIASDSGGFQEIIIPNKTGWLFPQDDAEALSATIMKVLLLSKNEKEKISKAAQEHIKKNFNLSDMAQKTLEIYQSVLRNENINN